MTKEDLVPGIVYNYITDLKDYIFIGFNHIGKPVFQSLYNNSSPFEWTLPIDEKWREKKLEAGKKYRREDSTTEYLLIGYDNRGTAIVENIGSTVIFREPDIHKYTEIKDD